MLVDDSVVASLWYDFACMFLVSIGNIINISSPLWFCHILHAYKWHYRLKLLSWVCSGNVTCSSLSVHSTSTKWHYLQLFKCAIATTCIRASACWTRTIGIPCYTLACRLCNLSLNSSTGYSFVEVDFDVDCVKLWSFESLQSVVTCLSSSTVQLSA